MTETRLFEERNAGSHGISGYASGAGIMTILIVVIGVAEVMYVTYVVSSGQNRDLGVSTINV